MTTKRRFLGWCADHGPAAIAVSALLDDAPRGVDGGCDLSRTLVVTATRRPWRFLDLCLAESARERSLPLVPPSRCTVASMAARAIRIERASRPLEGIEWLLLTHEALRRLPHDAASLLMPHGVPSSPTALARIASALDDVTQQLVDAGRSAADVAGLPCVSSLLADRWNALHAFHLQCDLVARELSNAAGVSLHTPWQWNELLLDQSGGEARIERVILIGVLDLTPFSRRVVDRLGQLGCSVEAWVIAPDCPPWNAEAFDELGCVTSKAAGLAPEIPEAAIEPAEDALDQCEAALARFSAMCHSVEGGGQTADAAEQPVVVSCDPELTPLLQSVAMRHGRTVHSGAGVPFALTVSGSLLRALAQLNADCTPATLARFLSQPAVLDALQNEIADDPRAILDRLRQDNLLHSVSDLGEVLDQDRSPRGRPLAKALQAIDEEGVLPRELGGAARNDASAAACASAVMRWMSRMLRGSLGDPVQSNAHAALQLAADSLARCAFGTSVLPMGTVVALLQQQMEAQAIPVAPEGTEIEAIGWLDALFEPARRMVLIGLREGTVPSQPQPDGWFTDPIRVAIGVPGRQARLHRDAVLLAAVSARASSLAVIGGMVDSGGEPIRPSRLLFPRGAHAQAKRILRLYGQRKEDTVRIPIVDGNSADFHAVPKALDFSECELPKAVSATSCKQYLSSPFEFWLKKVLRLNEPIVFPDVMGHLHFGGLLHGILRRLNGSAPRDGSEAAWMEELEGELDRAMRAQFGRSPSPTVAVQRMAAVARLRGVLQWHMAQAAEGWVIREAEWQLPHNQVMEVDGQPIGITGRIDRIDVNARLQKWRVIDYKVGDSEFERGRVVTKDGIWKDPQIPLYVHLVPSSFPDLESMQLTGHVLSVDAAGRANLIELVPSGQDTQAAMAAVEKVIRALRAAEFGEAADYKPSRARAWLQRDAFGSLLRRVPGGSAEDGEGDAGSESQDSSNDGGAA